MAPNAAPSESADLQEKSATAKGPMPLGSQMGSSASAQHAEPPTEAAAGLPDVVKVVSAAAPDPVEAWSCREHRFLQHLFKRDPRAPAV
jgi:hypothetical protein